MNIESVIEKCKLLKLKAIADQLEQTLVLAEQRNWTALQTIDHLFELELELRRKNKIERCFKQSRLYEKTTIDQFDFAFHGSRKNQKSRILNLLDLGFIEQRKDIILIGNPGVGKSFLAKCMAYAATQAGLQSSLYHRYGYDQSPDRCRRRPFAAQKTPSLSISGSAGHRRNRLSFSGHTGIKSILPGHQRQARKKVDYHNDQSAICAMGRNI